MNVPEESIKPKGSAGFSFQGPASGVTIVANLQSQGSGKYLTGVTGMNSDLSNVNNPVVATPTMGKEGKQSIAAVFTQPVTKKSINNNSAAVCPIRSISAKFSKANNWEGLSC
jgi:hypothetical protein